MLFLLSTWIIKKSSYVCVFIANIGTVPFSSICISSSRSDGEEAVSEAAVETFARLAIVAAQMYESL